MENKTTEMKIEFSEDFIKNIVIERINKIIDDELKSMIHSKVIDLIDSILVYEIGGKDVNGRIWDNTKIRIDKEVEKQIKERIENEGFLNKEHMKEIEKNIAKDIACELEHNIHESIANSFNIYNEDNDYE